MRTKNIKKITLPVKQQVGFQPGTFWSTVECFKHLATVQTIGTHSNPTDRIMQSACLPGAAHANCTWVQPFG